ncbi:MAG: hypothetical protein H6745_16455 [Deltaproteobacteria bacterium]|nr:hypothetical protein [Deltaproteobacteria bacterium]
MCAEPSCEDGAEDGDETDVDCGGSCEPCEAGAGCASDADCRFEGVCEADGVASICRNATIGDIGNGERFTCVRLAEPGKVACWGANDYGQLGLGDTEARARNRRSSPGSIR